MRALIFDTETTGKAAFNKPSVDPVQPCLVQLGALLIDLETEREYGSMDLIVYPASWTIPHEAALIHGVSQKIAEEVGVDLDMAVEPFLQMVGAADIVVAHNIAFDKLIMERAVAMVDLAYEREVRDPFADIPLVCTMKTATDIVQKKGKRPMHDKDFKWPKLEECMKFFFDEGLEGAHNAIVDCRACARVLMELVSRDAIILPEPVPAEAA